ncbi:MAG: N-formylglutamate amidohydrolase [Gemmatimonadetes bacterium]|nr:N-formylglutamate amidohydrolase [Gemmatimonadota bacterium]NIR79773.1 N-formylglutamate amidohydrolase [Gemmatimonadota bacterium]NIT88469.1 N-formylglutamate amidohydrolase [Gemmatimonadota bacterium]NIU32292.1 N-formylglutamate amidohydrolase [Gemmatimonadota bacterium]NIU36829.1 N-formylglutamate amidohydrolase [Gemmatimonadota bacterium]
MAETTARPERGRAEPLPALLTCEHGGYRVPLRYRRLFEGREEILRSHRGWDPGALALARRLSRRLRVEMVCSTLSRLVVELNRSVHHPRLFSEFTRTLSEAERERILARYYHPYRERVQEAVEERLHGGGPALHLSVHTFSRVVEAGDRTTEIGLLYDPGVEKERAFCARWKELLLDRVPGLRIRRNHPNRGTADGLTRHLRRRFPGRGYLGIELEVRNDLLTGDVRERARVSRALEETLLRLIGDGGAT